MGQHKWEVNTRDVNNGWSFAYGGVTKCNDVLNNIKEIKGEDEAAYDKSVHAGIAETKVLRAFYHLLAMDLYGNVPIVDGFDAVLKQSTRAEVFAFIEKEIKDNLPNLQAERSYGRVTRQVGYTLLAKLYLNAEVYTGTERWTDALAMCDTIIQSGQFEMMPDIATPFKINNTDCKEIIFPIAFDAVKAQGNMFHLITLHYVHQQVYGFTTQPWNGPCAQQPFYLSYDDADLRKQQWWFVGPVKNAAGDTLTYNIGTTSKPVIIVPTISATADKTAANSFDGARFTKFEIEAGIEHHANNDFPVYRLADILLMKAEALLRINNGNEAAAKEVIRPIRQRAGLPDHVSLTLDSLLLERSHELCWEGHRRQDLIRFGQFNKSWGAAGIGQRYKLASDPYRNLFPIPQWVMDAAPGVYTQNAGY
jgi:hypothetical protein